ncbi:DUF4382 domain-containing protein [Hydrotalea sp.]|uniref:DUF4382 domain-containing protein n=1 Tax=Hydrotalea sp. TaxID=2881279 RepID=UPI002608A5CD|nr:DUF4382 domain-containing protein [Hydrotalea sp.]
MKNKMGLLGLLLSAIFIWAACSKSNSVQVPPGTQQVSLYMTDGPGFFDHVYLDIDSVMVLVDTSTNTRNNDTTDWDHVGDDDEHHHPEGSFIWENLRVQPGVYDILSLRNGVDTLLASANIKAGAIRLIRINLGTRNSLVKDSITYPLNLLPGSKNFVLIKMRGDEWEEYQPGASRLWLDFDVARSVIQWNNQFYLKPVFRFFTEVTTGSISGTVVPYNAYPVLSIYSGTDTAYALPNKKGQFKVRGLQSGTYSVFVNASNGYKDTTINNINISGNSNVNIGVIQLHQ